jgi:adenine-specific DNA-methyltransferase
MPLENNDLIINFDSGKGEETLDSKLGVIDNVIRGLRNSYIGNKRKLIFNIIKTIDKYGINYDTVLDLFSGSAYVSMAFKMLGKKVICNDISEFAYLNALVYVFNNTLELSSDDKKFLMENENEYKDISPFFDKYKDRFTEGEIKFLSNYYHNVNERFDPNLSDGATMMKSSIAILSMLNYILSYCFVGGRLNNGQVLAKLDHRLNHARNFNGLLKKGTPMSFKESDMIWAKPVNGGVLNRHDIFKCDSIELLEKMNEKDIFLLNKDIDLCYIDPPYGGDQSDYASMYDFINGYIYLQDREERETILDSYLDEFKVQIKNEIEAKKRFVNKKTYEKHFDKLISLTLNIPWIVISYNDTSWGSVDNICSIVKKHRKNVKVEEFSYSYNYRSKSNNKLSTKEYLILSEA